VWDWRGNVLFILPGCHRIKQILDKVERGDTEVVMVAPEWTSKGWRPRLIYILWLVAAAHRRAPLLALGSWPPTSSEEVVAGI